jgi:arylsulfatase A-like enzyme
MMPLRNSRSRIVGFTVAALVLLLSLSAKGAKQPNIIYILADDLGYGDISLFGQERFKTPNIDRIAKEGIRFTQHYSGSTVCAPSRSCLMTGLHTGHTPIRGNFEIRPEGQKPMPAETVTVAELLEKEGYVTGAFGKWGLGFPGSEGDPTKQGFDAFFGYNCQRIAHNYYPYHVWENENKLILTGNEGRQEGVYAPEMIQERTLEFIEANRDKPFFCYVPHVIPHAEMFAPESYMERFRGKYMPEKNFDGTDDGPNYRDGGYGSQPESHAAFVAMVTMLDDHVGQILDKVDELGIADNTIILFTSDNGPHMEGGADPEYFNSNGPLRGYKRDLYEGGIRVPLLARWPGKIKAGSKTDHVSAFWDFLPTVCDLAGIKTPKGIDGVSYAPTLLRSGKQQEHSFLYWAFHEKGGRVAVRKDDWKLVKYNVDKDADANWELYDLSKDVGESRDVASRYPEVVRELSSLAVGAEVPSPIEKFQFQRPIN